VGTGQFTGRSPKDKFIVRDERHRNGRAMGARESAHGASQLRSPVCESAGLLAGPRPVRPGLLRGRRPALHPAHPGDRAVRLALPVRAPIIRAARSAAHRGSHTRVHHLLRSPPAGHSQRRRHQLGDLHRGELYQESRVDLRHQLRGRDEEVRLHHSELPAAGARHHAHALLLECGKRRRRGPVLRLIGHGQDHACPPIPNAA
jgi:hypothetical protein